MTPDEWRQRYPHMFRMIAEKPDPMRYLPDTALVKAIEASGVEMSALLKEAAAYSRGATKT